MPSVIECRVNYDNTINDIMIMIMGFTFGQGDSVWHTRHAMQTPATIHIGFLGVFTIGGKR